jgi:cell division protein ZipA
MEIELRVVLLGVGLLILLVVAYDFFKRKPSLEKGDGRDLPVNHKVATSEKRSAPSIDEYIEKDIYETSAVDLATDSPAAEMLEEVLLIDDFQAEHPTQHIITVSIMSRDQYGFSGDQLLNAIEAAEFTFGRGQIFHRYEGEETLFSVVNAMEPGYFIIETMPQEHIPGITLILLPDQVKNPVLAFDKMIRAAKQIAFAVNGELMDHFKNPLTLETINQYRQEALAIVKRS